MDTKDINLEYCRSVCTPDRAEFPDNLEDSYVQMNNDGEIHTAWRVGTLENAQMIQEYLRLYTDVSNGNIERQYVNNPKLHNHTFEGKWRQAYVRLRQDRDSFLIIRTLRRGYMETLTWDEARMAEVFMSEGNSESITPPGGTVIANTASDNPERVLFVDFPNVSPKHYYTVAAAITASYSSLTVEEQTYTGTFHKVIIHPQRQGDGSITIQVVLAEPQYTINSYTNKGGTDERQVGYLWQVPKQLAQDIVDAWGSNGDVYGRTASASFNPNTRLVDIVLSASTVVNDNMTTDWMDISCDRYRRWHFGWGYDEDAVDTFITDHSDQTTGEGIGDLSDGHIIRSRDVSIRTRGDGLFDIVITEESFGPHEDPEIPDYTLTLPIGDKISRIMNYGWNLSLTEISTADFKAVYESSYNLAGYSVDFQITRKDDCSYDYRAVITKQIEAIEHDATVAGTGVTEYEKDLRGADSTEVTTLTAANPSAPRQRVAINLEPRDDNLVNVRLKKITTVETEEQKNTDAVDGIQTKILLGGNADDLPTLRGGRKIRTSGSVSAKDDGTKEYLFREDEVVESDESIKAGNKGRNVDVRVISNKEKAALNGLAYPTNAGQSVEVIGQIDDAGNLVARVVDSQKVKQEAGATFGDREFKYTKVHTIADLDETQADDDGLNVDDSLDEFNNTEDDGVTYTIQHRKLEDGSKEWDLVRREAQEVVRPGTNLVPTTLSFAKLAPSLNRGGYTDTTTHFRSVTYANLPSPSGTYYFFSQLALNGDGTFTGVLVNRAYELEDLYESDVISYASDEFITMERESVVVMGSKMYEFVSKFKYVCVFSSSYSNVYSNLMATIDQTKALVSKSITKWSVLGHEVWYGEAKFYLGPTYKRALDETTNQ